MALASRCTIAPQVMEHLLEDLPEEKRTELKPSLGKVREEMENQLSLLRLTKMASK